jgi:hypothetical protein
MSVFFPETIRKLSRIDIESIKDAISDIETTISNFDAVKEKDDFKDHLNRIKDANPEMATKSKDFSCGDPTVSLRDLNRYTMECF